LWSVARHLEPHAPQARSGAHIHEVRTADPNLVTARGDRYWTKVQRFGGNFAQARYGEQAVRSS